MKNKLVRESILKGPTKEEIKMKKRSSEMSQQEYLRKSIVYNYFEGIIDSLESSDELIYKDRISITSINYEKLPDDKIDDMIHALEKHEMYDHLVKLSLQKGLDNDLFNKYFNQLNIYTLFYLSKYIFIPNGNLNMIRKISPRLTSHHKHKLFIGAIAYNHFDIIRYFVENYSDDIYVTKGIKKAKERNVSDKIISYLNNNII